jgi:peroxidase
MESNEIHEALPLIDVFKTSIGRFCSKPQKCELKRFRNYDGTCNNLDNPNWGAISAPFRRLIPPDYADGISPYIQQMIFIILFFRECIF